MVGNEERSLEHHRNHRHLVRAFVADDDAPLRAPVPDVLGLSGAGPRPRFDTDTSLKAGNNRPLERFLTNPSTVAICRINFRTKE